MTRLANERLAIVRFYRNTRYRQGETGSHRLVFASRSTETSEDTARLEGVEIYSPLTSDGRVLSRVFVCSLANAIYFTVGGVIPIELYTIGFAVRSFSIL